MQIFLGKNWLGQSDRQDVNLSSSKKNPLQIKHQYDLSALSEQELLTLRGILTKAEPNEGTADNS